MKKSLLKAGLLTIAGAVLVLGLVALIRDEAHARPNYKKEFETKYPKVAASNKIDCNVCHYGDSKKNRNDYGKAMGKGLPGANCKDSGKVQEALSAAEKEKNADGKTFGELLEAGKLPGKNP